MSWSLGALALAGASLAAVPRYKDGPPPGHTGGFGEPTCRACHSDAGLNEPGGDVAISGAPAAFEPGRRYELEVVLRRAGMLRAGFQLAARVAEGEAPGVLRPSDGRTAVVWDSVTRVGYIEHTTAGTAVVSGERHQRRRLAARRLHLCERGASGGDAALMPD